MAMNQCSELISPDVALDAPESFNPELCARKWLEEEVRVVFNA
jgi:hypothetical protein